MESDILFWHGVHDDQFQLFGVKFASTMPEKLRVRSNFVVLIEFCDWFRIVIEFFVSWLHVDFS